MRDHSNILLRLLKGVWTTRDGVSHGKDSDAVIEKFGKERWKVVRHTDTYILLERAV